MSQGDSGESAEHDLVRSQEFDTSGPIELDLSATAGTVRIELTETARTHVEIRHDPDSTAFDWRDSMLGLLNWVSGQFSGTADAEQPTSERAPAESVASAIRETTLEFTSNTLTVRTPNSGTLRTVPVAIRITAPEHSLLRTRTGSAALSITGTAEQVCARSGDGSVSVERTTAKSTVRCGSGTLWFEHSLGGVDVQSGSGNVEITTLHSSSTVYSSTGDVRLGEVAGDVLVRTGSGDVTVADAVLGHAQLMTGSGELQVSIRVGVSAEVDLTASTGSAISDLAVLDDPPEQPVDLHIYGRTGTGNAELTSMA